jgi:general secretion pathway protein D
LIRDDVQVGSTRVPLLGSIPLVGKLFRTESSTKTKTNLLVFIRATIMRDDRELQGATAEKYSNIRNLQIEAHGKEGGKAIPVLPELHDKPLSSTIDKKPEAILPVEPAVIPAPSTIAPASVPVKAE